MRQIRLVLLLLPVLAWCTSFVNPDPVIDGRGTAEEACEPTHPAVDYCKLGGVVYVQTVQGFADYNVFVEDVEAFSQMLVYQETSPGFADAPGLWYFTEVRGFADFSIYITDVKAFADFSIHYTDFKSLAGCRR